MPNDTSLVWGAIFFLLVVVVVQWLLSFKREIRRREELAQQKRDIETLKQTFGKYVPWVLLDKLLEEGGKLGGEQG